MRGVILCLAAFAIAFFFVYGIMAFISDRWK